MTTNDVSFVMCPHVNIDLKVFNCAVENGVAHNAEKITQRVVSRMYLHKRSVQRLMCAVELKKIKKEINGATLFKWKFEQNNDIHMPNIKALLNNNWASSNSLLPYT